MLTSADMTFIDEIDQRFPQKAIRARFNAYASLPAPRRLIRAGEDLQMTKRAGWVRIGVRDDLMQNVSEHQKSCVYLSRLVKAECIDTIRHHDTPEAIVSDFTPADQITKAEKSRLEHLAADLIFSGFPNIRRDWQEYEDGMTDKAHMAHDIDKLEMCSRALFIEEFQPALAGALTKFWTYTEERLTTDTGKSIFAELRAARTGSALSPVYQAMKSHYLEQKSIPGVKPAAKHG